MNRKLLAVFSAITVSLWMSACASSAHLNDTNENSNNQQNNNNTVETPKNWILPTAFDDKVSPSGAGAGNAKVAFDNSGNAIIVWAEQDESILFRIFKSEFRNGSWTNPVDRSEGISPDIGDASEPAVEMDNNGNAIIVWQQGTGTSTEVYMSEYRNGVWSEPRIISGGGISSISSSGGAVISQISCSTDAKPQVVMNDSGEAVVVWRQCASGKLHLFKAEYRGGVWTYPATINDHISTGSYDVVGPHVAIDDDGNTVIVWMQNNGIVDTIYKKEYRSGTWSDPADAISSASMNAVDPYVAMGDNGDAIVVWIQTSSEGRPQVFSAEYRSGAWTLPVDDSDFISIASGGGGSYIVRAAMNSNGDTVLVWEQTDDLGTAHVFKAEYKDGVWNYPTDLTDFISPDGSTTGEPRVAMNDDGDIIIVWTEDSKLFKSEYKDGVWIHPADASDFISLDGYPVFDPELRINDDGKIIIVWVANDTEAHIFKAEYR